MSSKRKHDRDEEEDLMDLSKELHPISHYVNDRQELLNEGTTPPTVQI